MCAIDDLDGKLHALSHTMPVFKLVWLSNPILQAHSGGIHDLGKHASASLSEDAKVYGIRTSVPGAWLRLLNTGCDHSLET